MASTKRKDSKGYALRVGECQRKDGRYSYSYTDKRKSLLSNHLITESDAEMDSRATAAVRAVLDRAKVYKKPIAKYDTVTKRAYVEYADGEKNK